jgi:mono/diheme cytochrome c family protein
MKRKSWVGLLVVGLFWVIPGAGLAQQEELTGGKLEFERLCAVCHGLEAKGDGPVAQYLTTKPANLTQISKRNKGTFPFWRVYRMIDGRELVRPHGTREMPVWGERFWKETGEVDSRVQGKIFQLVHYLESIQEK